ncbi:hypothetical protein [Vibrio sp. ER1A]|uniref:hypothetical protein n=1 Tax=Vibrio sp. ER1A TaxID=1517681 RepID=UPI000689B3F0|nr:hypothetical protein [Vibrio sp. ER1A]
MPIMKQVVYVGSHEKATMQHMGRPYVFPRFVPVEVEEAYAYHLLQFLEFEDPKEAEAAKERQEKAELEAEERRKALEEAERREAVDNTWMVIVNGEKTDISKVNSPTLKTYIAAEELEIEPENVSKLEGETDAQALRRVVRDALHKKHGNPVEDENEDGE